jgi:hypothetical protein
MFSYLANLISLFTQLKTLYKIPEIDISGILKKPSEHQAYYASNVSKAFW